MKKKESSEADVFYVTINCNVPSASLFIDDKSSGTASGTKFLKTGSHTVRLNADGYETLSQSIQVNSGSRSFNFVMKEKENHLPPVIVLQNLVNNMVRVKGGTFTMGATSEQGSDAYSDEKPTHQVIVSSFSIGKYEVTQEEWEAVMGSNPSYFKGAKRPVENVSWNECQMFIRKLNSMTGKHFRLPTEAEWEYAARGGNKSIGYKYAGSDNLDHVAWYDNNSGSMTHNVGQKSPNELGVYDMSGNVWEWCQDLKGSYNSNRQKNPTGPSSGSGLVGRGGSWISNARYCRVSYRFSKSYDYKFYSLGLRLAL
jgi:formylglycine-generating enzyme required for sulfatase activity